MTGHSAVGHHERTGGEAALANELRLAQQLWLEHNDIEQGSNESSDLISRSLLLCLIRHSPQPYANFSSGNNLSGVALISQLDKFNDICLCGPSLSRTIVLGSTAIIFRGFAIFPPTRRILLLFPKALLKASCYQASGKTLLILRDV